MWRALRVFGILVGVWTLATPTSQAQGGGDRIYLASQGTLTTAPLPRGPAGDSAVLTVTPEAMAYNDAADLWAIARVEIDGNFEFRIYRFENGLVVDEKVVPLAADAELVLDLAPAPGGGLYLLTERTGTVTFSGILRRIDPDDDPPTVTGIRSFAEDVTALAPNGDQLWLVSRNRLHRMNPEAGLGSRGTDILLDPAFQTLAADTDSTGALWLLQVVPFFDPPPRRLVRLDPKSRTTQIARLPIEESTESLAIQPGCVSDPTTLCLQGGRFSAQVTWLDYDARSGEGQVAGGSADSGLFWFFDENNVELMVKMVDGCQANGHFWVFAAGTTDVAYQLEITDLLTGERFAAENSLGLASQAVTATDALATCGGLL